MWKLLTAANRESCTELVDKVETYAAHETGAELITMSLSGT